MNKKKKAEIVSVQELLALTQGEKEIKLKTLSGKKVKIRKITSGELANIYQAVGDEQSMEQNFWVILRGLVEPKMTIDQIKKLSPSIVMELVTEIGRYSGLDKKSVEKTRNLLGIQEPSA